MSKLLKPFWTASRSAILTIGATSGVINILTLAGSLFMLQVYDRVLTSRSVPTLGALLALVLALFIIQGLLDATRQRIFGRLGRLLDATLSVSAFQASLSVHVRASSMKEKVASPLRDLDLIRNFITGPGPAALFDLPWIPVYLTTCFLFHPYLGWLTLFGASVVTGIIVLGEFKARTHSRAVAIAALQRQAVIDSSQMNVEVLTTMNLDCGIKHLFSKANASFGDASQRNLDASSDFSSSVRAIRTSLQSMVLALGAFLAIRQEISGGAIIATSILASKALAPIDAVISQWRQFVTARLAAQRLGRSLDANQTGPPDTQLPTPERSLSVEGIYVGAPASDRIILKNVTLRAIAGEGIGIIGPSGSGKTTLVRALVGIWPALRGSIRLDQAPLDQYTSEIIGSSVSYLPQDVHLLAGTIAQNISRFDPQATDQGIIRAAKLAQVHDLIVKLPKGYDTPILDLGANLSAGQRQRIGLARALYGDPFLVVLDEPYSNLDSAGETALGNALTSVKARKGIFIIVAHRHSALIHVDKVLALQNGNQTAFGPRDQVMAQMAVRRPPPMPTTATKDMPPLHATLKVVGDAES